MVRSVLAGGVGIATPLSEAERRSVESYLMNKYSITPFKPVTVARESVLPGHTWSPAPEVKP